MDNQIKRIKEKLLSAVGEQAFNLWFDKTEMVLDEESNKITISFVNKFALDFVKSNYQKILFEILENVLDFPIDEDSFICGVAKRKLLTNPREIEGGGFKQKHTPPVQKNFPFVSFSDPINTHSLEDVIVGPWNQLAFSAIEAITKKGEPNSILFLKGENGCGKTFLLQAFCRSLRENGVNAVYKAANSFMGDIWKKMKAGKLTEFVDVLKSAPFVFFDETDKLSGTRSPSELSNIIQASVDVGNKFVFAGNELLAHFKNKLTPKLLSVLGSATPINVSLPEKEAFLRALNKKSLIIS